LVQAVAHPILCQLAKVRQAVRCSRGRVACGCVGFALGACTPMKHGHIHLGLQPAGLITHVQTFPCSNVHPSSLAYC
jgi:hypothetical protein